MFRRKAVARILLVEVHLPEQREAAHILGIFLRRTQRAAFVLKLQFN